MLRALKTWRDLWQHRARSVLVVLAVALGLMAAGTILNAWALVERATDLGYRTSLPVSATLVLDRADAHALTIAKAQPDIAAARLRRSVMAAVQANGRSRNAVVMALDDFQRADIGRLQLDTSPLEDGLWIERSSLDFSGASVGEPVSLKLAGGQTQSVDLRGLVRDVSQAPGWMENLVYLYGSEAALTRLGAPPGFNELQVRVRDEHPTRAEVRRSVDALKDKLSAAGYTVRNVDVPEPGQHIHAAQMDSLLMTQGAFGLLALLACGFLVVNLVSAMLAGQTREIAVMKVLGGSPRQIGAMVLAQAGALGLLASAIALPAALWLGRLYGGLKAELLNFPLDGIATPVWAVALQLAVGLALPLAAAALPVRAALSRPVGEALRDIGITREGQALSLQRGAFAARLVPLLGGWARPLLLSVGNAFRRRQRMLLTVLALAIGGAVYLGAANLRSAVRGSVDDLFVAQRYQVQIRVGAPTPAAKLEALAADVPGVAAAEAWRGLRTQLGSEPLTLLGVSGRLLSPRLIEGRWFGVDGELVVSRLLQRQQPALTVGSKHRIADHDWTIVGLVDAGPQAMAYTSRATLDVLAGNDLATSLVLRLDRPGSPIALLDAVQQLREAFSEAGIAIAASQSQAENRRVVEDHLLMVVDFLGAMGIVMIAVGAMGLASTMGLAVLERRREIGVLRAIGARNGAILALIQVEGLTLVALAWLASLPLALPLSALLEAAFGRIMFSVPWRLVPSVATALGWLGLMALISLIACALPARRALRIPAAQALAYN
ncbi:putative ABC transport system permease protein [Pelomonas saccharophila]|uniref:ABC transport system permease protein n=1 Tax=Roseateles saccharophilus TaxID=304 RepID=A0ABU1YSF8_ROSSA|nr:ABC transporter permease [Roseateles saccharophilus]MDR7271663.1 putative ABC transport system permease protein [Roseateles saccharophilus]